MIRSAAGVTFESVTKRYGQFTAVDAVSFTIAPGTLTTLLGPSGCGKTSTLRLIAGLESADSGRILIGAHDVTRLSAAERDVSMVFQSYALFPHMTVAENVGYGLTVGRGLGRASAEPAVAAALDLVGLGQLGARYPSELSGGQQQRVAVARAVVLEPSVLLFDEPLSNLDAALRRQMREDIRALQIRLGLTVAYVTHDQAEAMAISDQIVLMNGGRIAQIGTPRDLYCRPADRFVARFIGEANLVQGILERQGDQSRIRLGALSLVVPPNDLDTGKVDVAIRPHAIRLVTRETGLSGNIVKSAYLGTHYEFDIETPLGTLFATAPPIGEPVGVGDRVALDLDPDAVHVVKA